MEDASLVRLRPMTRSDLAAVSELGIRSKASWDYSPEEMAVFKGELTLGDGTLEELLDAQVAVCGDEFVGYFTLRTHDDGSVELEHLFVEPTWFGRGVGSLLLRGALAAAANRKIRELTIISDPNATGFYLRNGAVVVGQHRSSIAGREIPVLSMRAQE